MNQEQDLRRPCVYSAQCTVNGWQYVGISTRGLAVRRRAHLADSRKPGAKAYTTPFSSALRQYPDESDWKWTILHYADSKAELYELEKQAITDRKHVGVELYNVTSGGGSQWEPTPEFRRKISLARRTGLVPLAGEVPAPLSNRALAVGLKRIGQYLSAKARSNGEVPPKKQKATGPQGERINARRWTNLQIEQAADILWERDESLRRATKRLDKSIPDTRPPLRKPRQKNGKPALSRADRAVLALSEQSAAGEIEIERRKKMALAGVWLRAEYKRHGLEPPPKGAKKRCPVTKRVISVPRWDPIEIERAFRVLGL